MKFTKRLSEENIEKFMNGYLEISIENKYKEEVLEFLKELEITRYYIDKYRGGKFLHFKTFSTPHTELRNSDIKCMRKLTRDLKNERILKEIEKLKNQLVGD